MRKRAAKTLVLVVILADTALAVPDGGRLCLTAMANPSCKQAAGKRTGMALLVRGCGQKVGPENYIVISASDSKTAGSTWSGKGELNGLPSQLRGRYGKVFNIKTGAVIDNQLLYAVEIQLPFLFMIMKGYLCNAVKCEYYPFGELSITENGRSSLLSDYKTWYQTNWYAKGIDDGDYYGSQNNSIDIRRYNKATN